MKKQFLSLLVGLSMIFSLVLPVGAAQAGFSDVDGNAWYAQDVAWCVEHGLMDGTSGQAFSPDQPAVRAVLVEALFRQAGSPDPGQSAVFSDVAPVSPYYRAVAWAAEKEITTGYGDGRFGGEDPVTREQFATFLWRAAGKPDSGASEPFADQDRISGYAVSAAAWARGQDIIRGREGNLFDPQAHISRAEAAAMVHRWLGESTDNENKEDTTMPKLRIEIGSQTFTATLADNPAARAFAERLPLTLTMSELNGNEKFFYLDGSLPANASRPGQIKTGDLMLFGSDCLVLFYKSFSSSYSYTPLGSVDNPAGLASALGSGSVEVTFRAE